MINHHIPKELKIVAVLFLISGIFTAIEIIIQLIHGHVNLNFDVLQIWVCFGLLRLSRGWRTLGLVFLWFDFIIAPFMLFHLLQGNRSLEFKMFGLQVHGLPSPVIIFIILFFLFLSIWQYRVLTKPHIRRLFFAKNSFEDSYYNG
ncbi:MAG: hypothetical protein HQL32_15165 [Planctomycetes bacterium]|nr:hypothetical protein [Planctomycetota bacterium]